MASTINGTSTGNGGLISTGDDSGILNIQTNETTAITVDASQNVGVGTTSPTTKLHITGNLTIENSSNAPFINFVESGDNTDVKARIEMDQVSGTAGNLLFYTEGSGTLSERMRIDSSGNLLISGTSPTGTPAQGVQVLINGGETNLEVGHKNGTASGTEYVGFSYNSSKIGSITQNGTTGVLYNLTSDYRLKNNPVALTGAKDFVMALQPKKWQWWDGSGEGVGFIAHEFMAVAKYSGNGTKDAVDADGKPIHQSIQPSSSEVMANMVALIQEQQATINALTARIVALETA
jgi:hypothetical protein